MMAAAEPKSMIQCNFSGPQSVTDYPLRNQTLLALAGFALLVLVRGAFDPRARKT